MQLAKKNKQSNYFGPSLKNSKKHYLKTVMIVTNAYLCMIDYTVKSSQEYFFPLLGLVKHSPALPLC